jgi:hypothetical protein
MRPNLYLPDAPPLSYTSWDEFCINVGKGTASLLRGQSHMRSESFYEGLVEPKTGSYAGAI